MRGGLSPQPGLAADFTPIPLLHGCPEFIAFLLSPSHHHLVDCSARMLPPQLDIHMHIGEPIHFQCGGLDDFAPEVLAVRVGARWDAQQLPEAVDWELHGPEVIATRGRL